MDYDYNHPLHTYNLNKLLQSSFRICELSKLTKKITDGTHYTPKYVSEGVPFISVKDIHEFGISFSDTKFVTQEEHEILSKRCNPQTDDILLTKVGTIGKTAVVPANAPIFDIFVSLCLIKPNNEIVDSQYLSNVLNSTYVNNQFRRELKGVGVPDLHLENIRRVLVPFPPMTIQKKLVDDLEDARNIRKAKLAEAEDLLAGLDDLVMNALGLELPEDPEQAVNNGFAISFKDISDNGRFDPEFYNEEYARYDYALKASPVYKVKLSKLSTRLVGGATPSRSDRSLYAQEGIKFLRIMNVAPHAIDLNDVKYITGEVHNNLLGRSQLQANDVLMTITGRVGTCAVVREDILPANINQHIVRIRLNGEKCLPDYFTAYMNSKIGFTLSNRWTTGGTRGALDYGSIRNLDIPIPTINIQKKIITEQNKLRKRAQELRQEADVIWQEAQARFELALIGESTERIN